MQRKILSFFKTVLEIFFDESIFFVVLFVLYKFTPIRQVVDFKTIVVFITECLLCMACFKRIRKFHIPLKTVFFPKDTPICLLLVLACASASFVIKMCCILPFDYKVLSSTMRYFQNHNIELSATIFQSTTVSAVDIMAIFSAPILEEIVFRFFLYYSLKVYYKSIKKALIVTSLLFASLHIIGDIIFGSLGIALLVSAFIQRFSSSAIMTACYERTGNVLSPVIIHMLWNITAIFLAKLIGPYRLLMIIVLLVLSLLVLTIWCIAILWKHISRKKLVLYHEVSTESEVEESK